jgi:hypothetical protein
MSNDSSGSIVPSARDVIAHTLAYAVFYSLIATPAIALSAFVAARDAVSKWPLTITVPLLTACAVAPLLGWLGLRSRHITMTRAFDHALFENLASRAKKIQILNTYIPQCDLLVQDLVQALRRGATVEILLLHPLCPEVEFRAESLGQDSQYICDQIKKTIAVLEQHVCNGSGELDSKLHLYLYESWPPFSIYRSEREAMVGFYLNGILAVDGPQIVLSKKDRPFELFADQFERIKKGKDTRELPLRNWRKEIDKLH